MIQTFQDLGLSPVALEAIAKKGFEEPTEIQAKTIPVLLESKTDVIAQAQTGTGKTATFGLVFTDKLQAGKSKSPQAIVLAPTRELAVQVAEEISSLTGAKKLSVAAIYGGQSWGLQTKHLRSGVDIVVGTPGRVKEHLDKGTLKLDQIDYFVLDEADEMLNMGFIEDIEDILSYVKKERQVLLFSATMPKRIADLARNYMRDPISIKTQKDKITNNSVDQIYFEVPYQDKFEALCRIIDMEDEFYGIIFCRTRRDSDQISKQLTDRGYKAEAFHGDISQDKRESILRNFRNRKTEALVATDVAARGIDVSDLTHVINFALPQNSESYVHRIGRTGRAGKEGKAITLITPAEYQRLRMFEHRAKADIQKQSLPDGMAMVDLKKKKIMRDMDAILSDTDSLGKYEGLVDEMFPGQDHEAVIAALLKYTFADTLDERSYKHIRGRREPNTKMHTIGKNDREKRQPVNNFGQTRLFLTTGRNDGATVHTILQMIEKDFGVPRKMVGDIDIMEGYTFITVPMAQAQTIMDSFHAMKKHKKPNVRIERAAQGKKNSSTSGRGKRSGGRMGRSSKPRSSRDNRGGRGRRK